MECGNPLSKQVLKQTALKANNFFDSSMKTRYINNVLRKSLFNKPFGLLDWRIRHWKRKQLESDVPKSPLNSGGTSSGGY